ncbi:hypothetical protein ACN265_09385 [Micromonospora sp. WMMD730]|uniref:hypothetical protein n=1 Tax=Micromonospora sp. WMMD730 TaxID=3404128 RepID=UPI003B94538A
MTIGADHYDYVIGVDTHAASYTLALINSSTGAVEQQAQLEPARPGCATPWIQRHTQDTTTLIVIGGAGPYGAAFTEQLTAGPLAVPRAEHIRLSRRIPSEAAFVAHAAATTRDSYRSTSVACCVDDAATVRSPACISQ